MTEKPVMLLPEPDSPTRPTISPACTRRSTPSTAFTTPPWVKKWVCRPCTSSTGRFVDPEGFGDIVIN